MNCYICKKFTKVIDSRKHGNTTIRRRECVDGHRFSTHEVVKKFTSVDILKRVKELERKVLGTSGF